MKSFGCMDIKKRCEVSYKVRRRSQKPGPLSTSRTSTKYFHRRPHLRFTKVHCQPLNCTISGTWHYNKYFCSTSLLGEMWKTLPLYLHLFSPTSLYLVVKSNRTHLPVHCKFHVPFPRSLANRLLWWKPTWLNSQKAWQPTTIPPSKTITFCPRLIITIKKC